MNNVKILDCTLRDGGRVNGCSFPKGFVERMIYTLTESGIDIIEVGFLRGNESTQSSSIRFFFTDMESIVPYLPKVRKSIYVVFVDFGLYDFNALTEFDGRSVDGIRLAFTKKDFDNNRKEILRQAQIVKQKGYKLFLQGIDSLSYSDRKLLDLIDFVNEAKPYAFGIVDTFGSMYIDDVQHYYQLINHNLSPSVIVDFHSHNNYQLSFSFAQEVIKLSYGYRNIIIDATLKGMGKGAGNLNTELLVNYLVSKKGYSYDVDRILDIIDTDIYELRKAYEWGYSLEYFMAGVYRTNPNNIIHMLGKYRLNTNDIKNVLTQLSDYDRSVNSFAKIDAAYDRLRYSEFDDSLGLSKIQDIICGKKVLVLGPGKTHVTHKEQIEDFIKTHETIVFSVNFVSKYADLPFFANKKRYFQLCYKESQQVIVTSDIAHNTKNEIVLAAKRVKSKQTFDSALMVFLYLLVDMGVKDIAIAGMDGYSEKSDDNYFDSSMVVPRTSDLVRQKNVNMQEALTEFIKHTSCDIALVTPSKFTVRTEARYD